MVKLGWVAMLGDEKSYQVCHARVVRLTTPLLAISPPPPPPPPPPQCLSSGSTLTYQVSKNSSSWKGQQWFSVRCLRSCVSTNYQQAKRKIYSVISIKLGKIKSSGSKNTFITVQNRQIFTIFTKNVDLHNTNFYTLSSQPPGAKNCFDILNKSGKSKWWQEFTNSFLPVKV